MVISGFAASTVWIGSDETQSQLLYIFCSVIKERLSEKKRKRGDDMQQRDPGRCSKDSVLIHTVWRMLYKVSYQCPDTIQYLVARAHHSSLHWYFTMSVPILSEVKNLILFLKNLTLHVSNEDCVIPSFKIYLFLL